MLYAYLFFLVDLAWDLSLITDFLMVAYCFCSSLLVAFRRFHSCSRFMVVLQIPKYRVPSVSLSPLLSPLQTGAGI